MQATAGRLDGVVRRLPTYTLAAFVLLTAVLSTLGLLSAPSDADPARAGLDGPAWLDPWFQGDSFWYLTIVEGGYWYVPGTQSPIAFFPAYPLQVDAVGQVSGLDSPTAAGLLTLVCAAGALMLFADWVRSRVAPRTAVVAVAVALVYPYSLFLYGSGYGEASYLLSVLGAFALLERRHYVLAGLVGAVATAGRPVGAAVAVGLVVRATELLAEERSARRELPVLVGAGGGPVEPSPAPVRTGWSPVPWRELLAAVPFLRWRQAALLLSGAGLLAWMVYLGVRFGDPVAFATVQGAPGWYQPGGPSTWFKVAFFGTLYHGIWDVAVLIVPQALACLAAVLLVRTVWRRFGWGYAAYAVVSLAIPIIGTKDFMGSGRYVLAAFPVLAAAAVVLTGDRRPRWLAPVVLAVLFVGLCIGTVAYVNGVEVS